MSKKVKSNLTKEGVEDLKKLHGFVDSVKEEYKILLRENKIDSLIDESEKEENVLLKAACENVLPSDVNPDLIYRIIQRIND